MKGLQTLIVDKETVLAAVQEYLDKSITPNVIVKSIAPFGSGSTSQYGGSVNPPPPDKFEIKVEPKGEPANG